jgi:hypothetical protein
MAIYRLDWKIHLLIACYRPSGFIQILSSLGEIRLTKDQTNVFLLSASTRRQPLKEIFAVRVVHYHTLNL